MTTVKITQLPAITLSGNTSNTIIVGVDSTTVTTGQMTAKTLALGLYANTDLSVGLPSIYLPNAVGNFTESSPNYTQVNHRNINDGGTADFVVTANTGTDTNYYLDLGLANANYNPNTAINGPSSSVQPLDGYLYIQGGPTAGLPGGNLSIGVTGTGKRIKFFAGGSSSQNVMGYVSETGMYFGLAMLGNTAFSGNTITFSDASTQSTAAVGEAYSVASFGVANSALSLANSAFSKANANYIYANSAFITANSAYLKANSAYDYANTVYTYANAAFSKANTALQNTSGTFAGSLYITGTVSASNGQIHITRLIDTPATTLVINFATDGIIRANLNSSLTISFTNFAAGKVVEVFLRNTSGQQQTVTHGISALNSTTNSTTFTIPATSSRYVKYFSTDGDVANTFNMVV